MDHGKTFFTENTGFRIFRKPALKPQETSKIEVAPGGP
jgi:hypothetical protein